MQRSTNFIEAIEKLSKQTNKDLLPFFNPFLDNIKIQLNDLDKQILEKRVNLRNIKCEEYIKEIYESHLYDHKNKLRSELEEKMENTKLERAQLRSQNVELEIENEKLKNEVKKMEKMLGI